MGLKDTLMNDFKEAMKSKDDIAKNTISLARAAIKQYEIDNREKLDDKGVISILQKQVKMRKDGISDFEKAGRSDLVEAYNKEIDVLKKYIPKQLSKDEILEIVRETAEELNIEKSQKSMGKLMGPVMGKVKGLADGNDVRSVVMAFLKEE